MDKPIKKALRDQINPGLICREIQYDAWERNRKNISVRSVAEKIIISRDFTPFSLLRAKDTTSATSTADTTRTTSTTKVNSI